VPTLTSDAVEVERIVRPALVTLFSGITGLPHVVTHRVYIDGEADAKRRMGFQHPSSGKTEYRLLVLDFAGYTDLDFGCEDNPAYLLSYTVKLAVSHVDARPDASTSTDDYARILLTLRQRVLDAPQVAGYSQLRLERLAVIETRFGLDDETLIFGHHVTLNLSVEVTPTEP